MIDAVFKQKNGLQALVLAGGCGVLTGEQLFKLGSYLYAIDCPAVKMTTRQTLVVLVPEEKVAGVVQKAKEIGLVMGKYGNVIRNVKACAGGEGLCKRALGDALGLGIEIQSRYFGQDVPKDFKISTAGCSRACTDPQCADFGVIAKGKNSFDIFLGGRGGSPNPLRAQLIKRNISREDVFKVLDYVLDQYRVKGDPHERICRTIERIGIEFFIPQEEIIVSRKEEVDSDFAAFLAE